MSNPSNAAAPKRKDYIVTVDGPVTIRGTLRRKDDTVTLSPVEAKAYGPFVKILRAPKAASADSKAAVKG